MPFRAVLFLAAALLPVLAQAAGWQERPDWQAIFATQGANGTIAVADERKGGSQWWVVDAERAQQRFIPASTFKIAHALFALEAGVVRDEFQVFPWDGQVRDYPAWNRDQDLRSSMRNSTVWVYQWIAGQLGEDQARRYLLASNYGNADPSGGKYGYWLDGRLAISAQEQIAFLRRLYRNELPFKLAHQRLVKDVMIVEAGRDWILRAKTGWSGSLGWWVGCVEKPDGPVFFALNIDTPQRADDLPKREAVGRAVLRSLEALP
ncbi:class D beta-lactamase [Denitratisoma sp. agr-D3]